MADRATMSQLSLFQMSDYKQAAQLSSYRGLKLVCVELEQSWQYKRGPSATLTKSKDIFRLCDFNGQHLQTAELFSSNLKFFWCHKTHDLTTSGPPRDSIWSPIKILSLLKTTCEIWFKKRNQTFDLGGLWSKFEPGLMDNSFLKMDK